MNSAFLLLNMFLRVACFNADVDTATVALYSRNWLWQNSLGVFHWPIADRSIYYNHDERFLYVGERVTMQTRLKAKERYYRNFSSMRCQRKRLSKLSFFVADRGIEQLGYSFMLLNIG